MEIVIGIPFWMRHHNRVLYAALVYCEKENIPLRILRHDELGIWDGMGEGPILLVNGKIAYLDVADDCVYDTYPAKYDFYFKRSLVDKTAENVYPLGLHMVFTYKPLQLIRKMSLKVLTHPRSFIELVRATDFTQQLTNQSHFARDYRKLKIDRSDHGGRINYFARLWDPAMVDDAEEKSRREIQNVFRTEACRIIRKNFKNVAVGLYPDDYAKRMAPDMLMEAKDQSTATYLRELNNSDICIADDGLKDVPGAKLAEYIYFRKCVISTPIRTMIGDFTEGVNFLSTRNRADYESLPALIETALTNKRYLEIAQANDDYANRHLEPYGFFKRILETMQCL